MLEAISSSETSVLVRATRRNIPEDEILHIIISFQDSPKFEVLFTIAAQEDYIDLPKTLTLKVGTTVCVETSNNSHHSMRRVPKAQIIHNFRCCTLWTFWLLTNSVELSVTREAASCVIARSFPSILSNSKFHYGLHRSSPSVPILSQTSTVRSISSLQDPS
jgi:hypothetical protein